MAKVKPRLTAKTVSGIDGSSGVIPDGVSMNWSKSEDYVLLIKDASAKRLIKKVHTKHYGDFSVNLPPGYYTVVVVPPSNRIGTEIHYGLELVQGETVKVRVREESRTEVTVMFRG